jgi:hypothetical protein
MAGWVRYCAKIAAPPGATRTLLKRDEAPGTKVSENYFLHSCHPF